MKLGICSEIFKDWPLKDMFAFVKDAGYTGLEIAPFTMADSVENISSGTVQEIKELSQKYQVDIIGTHWLLIKPEGLSCSSQDECLRRKTADYLSSVARFTSAIGGDIMVFGSPKQRNILDGQTFREVRENVKEVLEHVLKVSEQEKVYVCLEPLAQTETNFINTAEQAVEFIKSINNPFLKLHLDVKAMSGEDIPFGEIIKKNAPYLKHFHANDANLAGPGFGDVDFAPIIGALKEIDYKGWLSVEVFDFSAGAETIARESIRYLKSFM